MLNMPNPPIYIENVTSPLKYLFSDISNKNQTPVDIKCLCETL